eukprot:scaffold7028_cov243-Pinguiococcus_pyrenoidosus.AAC.17
MPQPTNTLPHQRRPSSSLQRPAPTASEAGQGTTTTARDRSLRRGPSSDPSDKTIQLTYSMVLGDGRAYPQGTISGSWPSTESTATSRPKRRSGITHMPATQGWWTPAII